MKVDVDDFNMLKRRLNLDMKLARVVILKLGHFFAISIFPPCGKANEPSTNAPSNQPKKKIQALGMD